MTDKTLGKMEVLNRVAKVIDNPISVVNELLKIGREIQKEMDAEMAYMASELRSIKSK